MIICDKAERVKYVNWNGSMTLLLLVGFKFEVTLLLHF